MKAYFSSFDGSEDRLPDEAGVVLQIHVVQHVGRTQQNSSRVRLVTTYITGKRMTGTLQKVIYRLEDYLIPYNMWWLFEV